MATEGNQILETFIAGADLTDKKYTFIVQSATAERTVATPAAGAKADGVLLNGPKEGAAAAVAGYGRVKVVCGGPIPLGAEVATNAQGRAVVAAATAIRLGKATEAGVANQLITIDFYKGGNAA